MSFPTSDLGFDYASKTQKSGLTPNNAMQRTRWSGSWANCRPRLGSVFNIVLIHVVVGVAVIATAIAAPVKTEDRLLLLQVALPNAEMSLGELKDLADDEVRPSHLPVRVRISFKPLDSGRIVRWNGREMTLRGLRASIESQS